jgi:hypothetical protein
MNSPAFTLFDDTLTPLLPPLTQLQWLNSAYTIFGECGDEDRFDDDSWLASTARALYMLLAFSDAVLSRKGIFTACLQQLDDLSIKTKVGVGPVFLRIAGGVYASTGTSEDRMQLTVTCPTDAAGRNVSQPCSEEEWEAFVKDVALQCEALMFIGHKLKLQPLITTMHTFLQKNCGFSSKSEGSGMLLGRLGPVLSDRVVDAAMGSSTMTKQEWLHSILTKPCGFSGTYGQYAFLDPDLTSVKFKDLTLYFPATLSRDFAGSKEGTTVDVKLKLFDEENPEMFIGGVPVPVQLCIGHGVTDQCDLKKVTGSG